MREKVNYIKRIYFLVKGRGVKEGMREAEQLQVEGGSAILGRYLEVKDNISNTNSHSVA